MNIDKSSSQIPYFHIMMSFTPNLIYTETNKIVGNYEFGQTNKSSLERLAVGLEVFFRGEKLVIRKR